MSVLPDHVLEALARGLPEFESRAPNVYRPLWAAVVAEQVRRRGQTEEAEEPAEILLTVADRAELHRAFWALAANRDASLILGAPTAAQFFEAALGDMFALLEAQAGAQGQTIN